MNKEAIKERLRDLLGGIVYLIICGIAVIIGYAIYFAIMMVFVIFLSAFV